MGWARNVPSVVNVPDSPASITILRMIKTMLEDKDVLVRRYREGYEFFKSMAQRRSDLAAAKAAAA